MRTHVSALLRSKERRALGPACCCSVSGAARRLCLGTARPAPSSLSHSAAGSAGPAGTSKISSLVSITSASSTPTSAGGNSAGQAGVQAQGVGGAAAERRQACRQSANGGCRVLLTQIGDSPQHPAAAAGSARPSCAGSGRQCNVRSQEEGAPPYSFSMTATFLPCSPVRMWLISVVLPAAGAGGQGVVRALGRGVRATGPRGGAAAACGCSGGTLRGAARQPSGPEPRKPVTTDTGTLSEGAIVRQRPAAGRSRSGCRRAHPERRRRRRRRRRRQGSGAGCGAASRLQVPRWICRPRLHGPRGPAAGFAQRPPLCSGAACGSGSAVLTLCCPGNYTQRQLMPAGVPTGPHASHAVAAHRQALGGPKESQVPFAAFRPRTL